MALHSDTEIYRAVVELQRFVLGAAANFRRDVKPLLGGRLLDEIRQTLRTYDSVFHAKGGGEYELRAAG